MHGFSIKWGIFEKKMRDFWDRSEILEEKMHHYWVTWGISEAKLRFFELNGGFWRENAWSSFTCEIDVEEMRDFWVQRGILVAKVFALGLNWWIFEEKMRDFRLNGGFAKRKREIFA